MGKKVKEIAEKALELVFTLDHPVFQILNKQWKHSNVSGVELTGVGFYVTYAVPTSQSIIDGQPSFTIQGIKAQMDELGNDAGLAIFIQDGKLEVVERGSSVPQFGC